MTGAGKDEAHCSPEQARTGEHGFRRRDMVFAGGQLIDRDVDLAHIEALAPDLQATLGEIVLQVTVPQIEAVIRIGGASAALIFFWTPGVMNGIDKGAII